MQLEKSIYVYDSSAGETNPQLLAKLGYMVKPIRTVMDLPQQFHFSFGKMILGTNNINSQVEQLREYIKKGGRVCLSWEAGSGIDSINHGYRFRLNSWNDK